SFSQLCDQMMLKRNYAKSFIGLRARLIAKVTAVSLLQYINEQNDRPINNIKHALQLNVTGKRVKVMFSEGHSTKAPAPPIYTFDPSISRSLMGRLKS